MEVVLDDGMQFGLGLFETIAIEKGKPVFLEWHMERLGGSMEVLGIPQRPIMEALEAYLDQAGKEENLDHQALKVMVTKDNLIFRLRKNHYEAPIYEKGFRVDFSTVYRNETSPLIYHKTMNYGDCILEKRAAAAQGYEERIFLNSKGAISEGTISNIFFVRGNQLLTPEKSSGLLPGVMRRYVMSICSECGLELVETRIYPEEIGKMDECFLTNSLMGIMPVVSLGQETYSIGSYTKKFMARYQNQL